MRPNQVTYISHSFILENWPLWRPKQLKKQRAYTRTTGFKTFLCQLREMSSMESDEVLDSDDDEDAAPPLPPPPEVVVEMKDCNCHGSRASTCTVNCWTPTGDEVVSATTWHTFQHQLPYALCSLHSVATLTQTLGFGPQNQREDKEQVGTSRNS